MIALCTDFGSSLYTGQVAAKISAISPQTPFINLIDDLPAFNISASAYLLNALVAHLPENCIIIAVVDPGVGGAHAPICFKYHSRWFLGPDNGLFSRILIDTTGQVDIFKLLPSVAEHVSTTFHGRDVFAPAAATLANHENDLPVANFRNSETEKRANEWCRDLPELIYFDHFGSGFTGISKPSIDRSATISIGDRNFSSADKFSDVRFNQGFWYYNSIGLLEIAVNQGSAKRNFGLEIGMSVQVD